MALRLRAQPIAVGSRGRRNVKKLVIWHPQAGSKEKGTRMLSPPSPLYSVLDLSPWNGSTHSEGDLLSLDTSHPDTSNQFVTIVILNTTRWTVKVILGKRGRKSQGSLISF